MSKRYLIALIPVFFACNVKEDEAIDLEEIMPTSEYDKTPKTDTSTQVAVFQPSIHPEELGTADIVWDSVFVNEELSVPERFNPKSTEKFIYWKNGNPVEYYRWSFPDSTKSMKAFLNWMNCYGDRCMMVELRTTANIQRNAVVILQTDTTIIQIQTPSAGLGELKKWKKLYTTPKTIKWNYLVTQPKGGKAIWSKFEKETESEFVQLEIQ
jgi:hypothetical protein